MKIRNLLMCAIAFCMSVITLGSCSDDLEYDSVDWWSNDADFVVTNKTTGKTVKSASTPLIVNNGDELEMTYTPPKVYNNYSWEVDIDIKGYKTFTISKSPYTCTYTVSNMEAGSETTISCSAIIEQENVDFDGLDYNSITIVASE